jgi:hypothetical protein
MTHIYMKNDAHLYKNGAYLYENLAIYVAKINKQGILPYTRPPLFIMRQSRVPALRVD